MHDSRQSGAGHNTECAGVDLSVRIPKLRVIEKVERLKPKLQLFRFGELQALQQRINARRDELSTELQQMNSVWESAPAVGAPERAAALPLERLEQIYRVFSYVARWSEQIQERNLQLAAGSF